MALIQKVEIPPEEWNEGKLGRPRTLPDHCVRCANQKRRVIARGLCNPCIRKVKAFGQYDQYPAGSVDHERLLTIWHARVSAGVSYAEIAIELGMAHKTLTAALKRARRAGDPRAIFMSDAHRKISEGHRRRRNRAD